MCRKFLKVFKNLRHIVYNIINFVHKVHSPLYFGLVFILYTNYESLWTLFYYFVALTFTISKNN